jgi:ribose-phosphate pyrophosphokinase
MDFALIHKDRKIANMAYTHTRHNTNPNGSDMVLVGDVSNRVCILIDDIADTCYTITKAASLLKANGATKIYAIITHAIFSGDALQRINVSDIDEIVVCNSVPQEKHQKMSAKVKVLDLAPLFGEAIRRIHHGESVSYLFGVVPL